VDCYYSALFHCLWSSLDHFAQTARCCTLVRRLAPLSQFLQSLDAE